MIELGWWVIPLVTTLVAFGYAKSKEPRDGGDYSSVFNGLYSLMFYGAASIVSLIGWLIWALLK